MNPLDHILDREVLIQARRATVFRFFQDPARFSEWWGPGSTIEGRVGGKVSICMPGNVLVSGEVLEVVPERKIVFTYGFAKGTPIPPGGSRVTVILEDHRTGTIVHVRHEFADPEVRDQHVQGWRYQLALFANVAARIPDAQLARLLERWFSAWGEPDPTLREAALQACTTDDVSFRDQYACVTGRLDLAAHLASVVLHMPGVRLRRAGDPRQCQGTVLFDWEAVDAAGAARGRGTNCATLSLDGRFAAIVGFWRP